MGSSRIERQEVNWTNLTQNTDMRKSAANTVIKFQVP